MELEASESVGWIMLSATLSQEARLNRVLMEACDMDILEWSGDISLPSETIRGWVLSSACPASLNAFFAQPVWADPPVLLWLADSKPLDERLLQRWKPHWVAVANNDPDIRVTSSLRHFARATHLWGSVVMNLMPMLERDAQYPLSDYEVQALNQAVNDGSEPGQSLTYASICQKLGLTSFDQVLRILRQAQADMSTLGYHHFNVFSEH